jgi:uncharacterized membrane protein YbhN (UPF0104 family)
MKKINFKNALFLISYSLFLKGLELVDYFLIFKALGLEIPLKSLLTFTPLVMLISEIPITFLGLGSREAALVFFFSRFGSLERLLAAGILISFSEYLLPNLLSLLVLKPFLDKMMKNG